MHSRVTPTHPSRGRSLSICLEVSSSSTCHVSFVQHPHRLTTASPVWIWNTTLSLTLPPFRERNKKKSTHDALSPSEKMPRLSVVSRDIIHQNRHRHHHRQGAGAQVFVPFNNLSFPCSHPSLYVAFCAKLQPPTSTCTFVACVCLQKAVRSFPSHAWALGITACSTEPRTECRVRNPNPCPLLFPLAWQLCFRIPTHGRRKLLDRPSSR